MPLGHRPGTDHPPAGSPRRGFLLIKDPKHLLTSGSSLMACPSSTRRCMLEPIYEELFSKTHKSILIVFMKITFFYLDPYILLIFNLSC